MSAHANEDFKTQWEYELTWFPKIVDQMKCASLPVGLPLIQILADAIVASEEDFIYPLSNA